MKIDAKVADSGIGTLIFSNPPLNVLTQALLGELRTALDSLAIEPALRVLILASEGEHFSAGADVGEHVPPRHETLIPEFLETVRALAEFPVPVIAVVRGRCLGGGFELAQAADLLIAAEGTSFGQPEIILGVLPPAACALLPARVPASLAAELVFTGDTIDAARAREIGLVNYIAPNGQDMDAALRLANRIARHSAATLRMTKRALRTGETERSASALRDAGDVYLNGLMRTHDATEGLRAFLEKRKPAWAHQ